MMRVRWAWAAAMGGLALTTFAACGHGPDSDLPPSDAGAMSDAGADTGTSVTVTVKIIGQGRVQGSGYLDCSGGAGSPGTCTVNNPAPWRVSASLYPFTAIAAPGWKLSTAQCQFGDDPLVPATLYPTMDSQFTCSVGASVTTFWATFVSIDGGGTDGAITEGADGAASDGSGRETGGDAADAGLDAADADATSPSAATPRLARMTCLTVPPY